MPGGDDRPATPNEAGREHDHLRTFDVPTPHPPGSAGHLLPMGEGVRAERGLLPSGEGAPKGRMRGYGAEAKGAGRMPTESLLFVDISQARQCDGSFAK